MPCPESVRLGSDGWGHIVPIKMQLNNLRSVELSTNSNNSFGGTRVPKS